jgi:hypothetical protein
LEIGVWDFEFGQWDCHASLAMTSSPLSLRGTIVPKQSRGDMRLPRTFQVLAMTKTEEPDESGNYKKVL